MKHREQGLRTRAGSVAVRIISGLLLSLSVLSAAAQDSLLPQHFFSIRHDNDLLNLGWNVSDEYYTAGLYLNYGFLSHSDKNLLNKILFSPGHAPYSALTIGLTQWMYTPSNLEMARPRRGDYPYCGALFIGLSRETVFRRTRRFRSELWLGTTGPSALASEAQELVHHVIHAEKPQGWKNQLPDYPIINYNLYFETHCLQLEPASLNGFVYTQTGSLLNTLTAGLRISVSSAPGDYFPERIYALNKKEISRHGRIYLQLIPAIEVVASNSLLQGPLFGKKDYYHIPAGDLNRMIWQATAVAGLHLGRLSLSYQQVFKTREFRTVHGHAYGSIVIALRI